MWISVDPLQEEKPWFMPYHYCSVNPINRIDEDGNSDDVVQFWKNGPYVDMSKANGSSVTVKGFPRDNRYFWNQLLTNNGFHITRCMLIIKVISWYIIM